MSKKILLECISEPTSNKHFPHPYKLGEKVVFLGKVKKRADAPEGDESHRQYIRIKRLRPIEERVEYAKDFKFLIKPKTQNHEKV